MFMGEFEVFRRLLRLLAAILVGIGLIAGGIPSDAHQMGCRKWPHSGGILYLQHYVGYVDFASYPEYRDAIYDWNQASTPTLFYDGGTPTSYQVKSITNSYSDGWPGLAIIYPGFGCPINDAVILLNTRLMVTYNYFDRRHVECQELGHVLGLDHNTVPEGSCMNDQTYWQYYISSHDISDINALYPR